MSLTSLLGVFTYPFKKLALLKLYCGWNPRAVTVLEPYLWGVAFCWGIDLSEPLSIDVLRLGARANTILLIISFMMCKMIVFERFIFPGLYVDGRERFRYFGLCHDRRLVHLQYSPSFFIEACMTWYQIRDLICSQTAIYNPCNWPRFTYFTISSDLDVLFFSICRREHKQHNLASVQDKEKPQTPETELVHLEGLKKWSN